MSSTTNISNYTNGDRFSTLIDNINSNIEQNNQHHIAINNDIIQLQDKTLTGSPVHPLNTIANSLSSASGAIGLNTDPQKPEIVNLSAQGPINPASYSPMVLTKYLPPSNIAMSSFDKMGQQIDKVIKDTFITQMFHIKGTDILCTTMCLLMSLLPCQTTNKIADDIQKIKDIQYAVNDGIQQAIATEKFGLNTLNAGFSGGATGLANISDVQKSLKTAFNTKTGGSKQQQLAQEIKSVTAGLSMVVQLVNLLISVTKLGFQDPNALLGYLVNGMFDLLENVLLAMQALAVSMADKVMNKIIAPIEKYFTSNAFPALCGIGAQLLFKKILAVIYNFKKKILFFIADLFAFEKTARKKFMLFNSNMLWTLELSALMRVLSLILDNFLDVAIACGIGKRPCSGEKGTNLSENYNGQNDDTVIFVNTQPSDTRPLDGDVLDQIADKLQPVVDSIFPGSNGKVSPGKVTTEMDNLPPMIAGLLTNIDLGPNTTVSLDNNKATIVYNNRALCGAN